MSAVGWVIWSEPDETAEDPLPYCLICGADAVASRIRHTDTCPLARALDPACEDDDAWFAAHPGATVRHRPIATAEAAMGAALGWRTLESYQGGQTVIRRRGGIQIVKWGDAR